MKVNYSYCLKTKIKSTIYTLNILVCPYLNLDLFCPFSVIYSNNGSNNLIISIMVTDIK